MTMLEALIALVLQAAPPELATRPQPGSAVETVAERRDRLEAIARDAWDIAHEPEAPRLPGYTTAGSALVMLALARVESDFALDVDSFACIDPERRLEAWRCDNGHAIGLLQLHARDYDERTALVGSREEVFRVGLRRLRGIMGACEAPDARFALWHGAGCEDPDALEASKKRIAEVRKWLDRARELTGR
jgi:hypothetical protein